MRKTIVTVVLVAALVIATGVALAQGGDSVTHNTSWAFQNLGDTTAQVHVDLYSTDGTLVATDDFDVPTAVSFWAPDYDPLDAVGTFNGGLVASSSQPLASISNQVAANSTSGKTGNATYMGISADMTSPTMYAPVVMKALANYYWTELSIQSTATSGSITVNVHYFNEDGSEVTGSPSSYTVYAGSPTRVAQEDETILPDGWIGSARVEAADGTTPIALVVNEFVGSTGHMYDQFYSYEGFASGANTVVLPAVFINGYGGFNASASVMNLGGSSSPANVTWHFYDTTPGNPNAATEIYSFSESIPTSKAVYFPDQSYATTLKNAYDPGDDAWVGTVVLECTSGGPLVAIVNELWGSYYAASYTGLMGGADELFFPLAFVNAYGFADTSYSISDMSGTAGEVSVTVDYIADTTQCAGCSDWSTTYSFSNNDSKYQPDHIPTSAMDNGVYVGSIRITVNTPGKTINGVMNEIMGDVNADNFTSFSAFTK